MLSRFRRSRIAIVAHYSMRRAVPGTTQFQDCCISAGLQPADVALRLDWTARTAMPWRLSRLRRPLVIVPLPRAPFGRSDGYGMELLPEWRAVQTAIDRARRHGASILQVGAGRALHRFGGIDADLAGQTSVAELIDAVATADAVIGWCSFLVPLAESLGKPGLFVWSAKGLASADDVIRHLTPAKIFDTARSRHVVDDALTHEIEAAADALLEATRVPALV